MDATSQLALMTKAKMVFERPGTFLSFPALAPYAYSPAQLDFSKALVDHNVSAALLDFSRAVNQCPGGVIFQSDSDQFLWQHYDAWLHDMVLAQDVSSSGQDAAYNQAAALLTTSDANGLSIDSPALANYKQYRDQYFAAEQAYKSAQIAASVAQDAAAKAQWQSTDEPRLRQAVAEVMAAWSDKGNKVAIEAAQATVGAYGARSPLKMWTQWRAAYNPDLDMFTDPFSNASCGPSGFAPANVFDGPWTTFTLTKDEISGLTAQAPKELQTVFGSTGASEIASITFEFRSAAVVRTWFDSAVFDTRFWKFDGGLPDLSDGATPPSGAWPSYVSAVVFARNIRVTTVSAPQAPPQPIRAIPAVALRPEVLRSMQVRAPAPAPVAKPRVMMMARPMMATASATRVMVADPAVMRPVAAVSHPAPPPRTVAMNPALRLDAAIYRMPTAVQPPAPAGQPAPTTPAPTPPAPDDQVSILAFICRSLPKAPNPDPALHW
jgi:hypothetical protein